MLEEISLLLPEIIHQYTDSLSKKIDIEKMVTDKVAGFSSDNLEEILQSRYEKGITGFTGDRSGCGTWSCYRIDSIRTVISVILSNHQTASFVIISA